MRGEFKLIDIISDVFATPDGVAVGIGDDAAVLQPDRFDLMAMDTLVEGVHFRRDTSSARDVGWKALAVNLSDIAAMGGVVGPALLSLAVPTTLDERWVEECCRGLAEAGAALGDAPDQCSVVGGDVSATEGAIVITVTAVGESPAKGPVLRSGAEPGDRIVVTDVPGRSAAGLQVLESELDESQYADLADVHRRPRPPVGLGAEVGQRGLPTAMIDVSDGLLQDLGHILRASQVGAAVDLSELPIPSALSRLEEMGLGSAQHWVAGGGEDFCLLLTVPPAWMSELTKICNNRSRKIYDIGVITSDGQVFEVEGLDGKPMVGEMSGYRHFEEP